MSTTIYYFSSTGNCLDVAQVISDKLNCELLPMVGHFDHECDSECIGFVYPTYFWGLPNIVETFIRKIKIKNASPYIFGITCAKTSGGGLGTLNKILKEKGYHLDYGKTIHSISNYIVGYDINLDSVTKVTESAREQALSCLEDIRSRRIKHCHKIPLLTDWFHHFYQKAVEEGDKKFSITSDCIGCGICEKVCPVKNIKLKKGRPCFHHHCEHCIACLHWCPKQAIQYGIKTEKRSRYHNPNINIEDLNK